MILAYTGSPLTWFNYSNYATFYPHLWWYLLTQQYVQRCTCACCGTLSGFSLQYHLSIALAFGRGAVAKPSRSFPLQYRLLIALAFERGAGAKLSRGVPLQYRLLIALAFEKGALAKLYRHNEAYHLSVKRLSRVNSQFVSLFESKSGLKYTGSTPQNRRNGYKEYVLSRTRREAVFDITLRSNF